METQFIKLNMIPSGVNPCFHISQYDIGRSLGFMIYNGSEVVDLDSYTCTIEATRSDGVAITASVATDDNVGTFETTATMTNKADKYKAQFVIVDGDSNRIASLPFDMDVCKAAMDENAESIEEDASLYQQYTEAVQGAIAEANADIQAEENARIAAISAEATARANADTTLQNNIDAEATARANAIIAEATARQTADNTLQGNINSEASTRATQDGILQSQINQIIAPSGEAPSAAEVQNARIGADGVTYSTLGEAIRTNDNELKSALNNLESRFTVISHNLFDKSTAKNGYYIKNDGTIEESANWCISVKIPVEPNTAYYNSYACAEYEADGTFVAYHSASESGNITTSANTAYIIFSCQISVVETAYLNKGANAGYDDYKVVIKKDLVLTDTTLTEQGTPADAKIVGEKLSLVESIEGEIVLSNNLFNKNSVIYGKYVNASGVIADTTSNNFISQRIPVRGGYSYYIWGYAGIYAEDDTVLHFHSINDPSMYTMPSNASYIICSGNTSNIDSWKVNIHKSQPYDDYKSKPLIDAILNGIVVSKSGAGDITSLTKALWDNIGKGLKFKVKPGEYDIIAEYKDYFGNDVFDASKFDENDDPIEHSAWYEGLPIKNCIIEMDSNAIVRFDYTGSVPGVIDWFSPFKYIAPGGELHGGKIICSNCRYAIHDDCYGSANDRRITDGVYIYYRSSRNVAVGGGLGKSSYVEFKNCYVDSTTVGYGIWYHNATLADAQNFVSIHDNYATSSIEIQALGPSTLMSKALVSNNKCHSVGKIANVTEGGIDNFEMVTWNNVTS